MDTRVVSRKFLLGSLFVFSCVSGNGGMRNLEKVLEHCTNKWQLRDIKKIEYETYVDNYLAKAYSALYRQDVVVKLCTEDTYKSEQQGLRLLQSNGFCVRLLDCDDQHNVLLLEHLSGPSLGTYGLEQDDEAIAIAAEVIRKFHTHSCDVLDASDVVHRTWMTKWVEVLDQGTKVPRGLLVKAKSLLLYLIDSQKEVAVLHGDLHQDNIIFHDDCWVAVDPDCFTAELEVEVIPFIMSKLPELSDKAAVLKIVMHRIDRFSQIFGFERQRLWQWLFVRMVLSMEWAEGEGYAKVFDRCLFLAQLADEHLGIEK